MTAVSCSTVRRAAQPEGRNPLTKPISPRSHGEVETGIECIADTAAEVVGETLIGRRTSLDKTRHSRDPHTTKPQVPMQTWGSLVACSCIAIPWADQ